MIEFRPLKDLKLVPPSPDRHWLVKGVLPASVVAEVYGPKMSGKTTFCSALAVAVNTGSKLLDTTVPHRFGPVVYVTSDSYSAYSILKSVMAGVGEADKGDLLIVTADLAGGPKAFLRELVDKVLNLNPRPALVVEDCAVFDVVALDEYDTHRAMLHELQRLVRVGISVLIAHPHTDGVGCPDALEVTYDSAQHELLVTKPSGDGYRDVLCATVHHGNGAIRFTANPIEDEDSDVPTAP